VTETTFLPLEAIVARDFPAPDQGEVLALLMSYGAAAHEREPDRVRWVIAVRAAGSLERVRRSLATATRDYRDVLIGDPGYNRLIENATVSSLLPRQPWFERRFTFDLPVTAAPGLLERLRGTPARLEERLREIPAPLLAVRHGEHWSIQENAGHLGDLEPLWLARVEDFYKGTTILSAADLQNRRTHEADHNARRLGVLLAAFRVDRARLVARLEKASGSDWLLSALHPRLQTPMRMLDHAYFVAEHDDHHLATITDLTHTKP
jgi:hypothetical protein